MKDIDLDDLFATDATPAKVEASPIVQHPSGVVTAGRVVIQQPCEASPKNANSSSFSWGAFVSGFLTATAIAVVIRVLFAFIVSDGGAPDPDVDPVNGACVAIFYQDTDLQNYSASQQEFLNSVNTANWLEERKVNWKKIDVDDSVDRLEQPFPIMAEKHRSKEPWIVIASGKKFASEPIESNEQAMKLLQKWVK